MRTRRSTPTGCLKSCGRRKGCPRTAFSVLRVHTQKAHLRTEKINGTIKYIANALTFSANFFRYRDAITQGTRLSVSVALSNSAVRGARLCLRCRFGSDGKRAHTRVADNRGKAMQKNVGKQTAKQTTAPLEALGTHAAAADAHKPVVVPSSAAFFITTILFDSCRRAV
jgi:hypothetical protein